MIQEIKLPQISEGEDSGMIAEVYISEGDQVEAEQSVIAVESDKATVDVPVEESGTVKELRVNEGDEISAGDIFLVLETNGESQEDEQEKVEVEEEPTKAKKTESKQDAEKKKTKTVPENKETTENGSDDKADIPAAPLAKKFARELGIDINDLKTSDPEQRINRADVLSYAKEIINKKEDENTARPQPTQQLSKIELPDFSQWGETETAPMDGIRLATAKSTLTSWQNIPHVTQFDKADITSLEAYRKQKDKKLDEKITVTAILLKIVAEALQTFPKFNASIDVDAREIIYKKYFHIGVAVDTQNGLLLPVIRDVNQKSIQELSKELTEIGKKAREGKLSSEEMKGGNFVISNLGGIGGTNFTPIVFPPQVAILGVSRSNTEPVYDESKNTFEPKQMLPLSLSYDHRLIDGADAARFLSWISETLKQPMNLMM